MAKKSKKRRTKSKPMLVSTHLGNTILSSENSVLVQISDGCFYRKKVSELNVGDLVLYENEHVKKAFNMSMLRGDPRYVAAEQDIHETIDGILVPKTRVLLARGLHDLHVGPVGVMSQQSLEHKITHGFSNDQLDFTRDDYKGMETYVHELGHKITGKGDCDRGFADKGYQIAAKLVLEKLQES